MRTPWRNVAQAPANRTGNPNCASLLRQTQRCPQSVTIRQP
jgi:hypothetical protein